VIYISETFPVFGDFKDGLLFINSIISYGIKFWGSSTHSKIIFKIQKRTIRTIANSGSRYSCRNLFKKLSILPFYPQYIFSLLLFVVKNKDLFRMNLDVHIFNTRSNCDLDFPMVNLTVCQKRVQCSDIKLYNHLLSTLKQISYDIPKFKVAFTNFLTINSFYTVEEYYCL
jgi:hypothetical protein